MHFSDGDTNNKMRDEYNSSNTNILDKNELIELLFDLPEIKMHLN